MDNNTDQHNTTDQQPGENSATGSSNSIHNSRRSGIFTDTLGSEVMDTPTYMQELHNQTPPSVPVRESPLRLSTFLQSSLPERGRDREEHGASSNTATTTTTSGGGRRNINRNSRENIATLGLRNALGLRRRHLFSSLQSRAQRHSSDRAHERRLLRYDIFLVT